MGSAILYQNLADEGDVTCSSWLASTPPATLQNPHVLRRWKGRSGDTEYILLTWPTAQLIDTVALFGVAVIQGGIEQSMDDTAIQRVRISSVDLTGVAGDLYDTGAVAGGICDDCGSLVQVLSVPVSAQAVRIDLSQAGIDAVMAGRLVVGLRKAFSLEFSYGWSYGYADMSRLRKSAGGQTFVDRDDRFRVLNMTYETLSAADFSGFVREIDRVNGMSRDVLMMLDTASSNLPRDSVWGLLQDMSPPSQPNTVYFQKTYRIEERR